LRFLGFVQPKGSADIAGSPWGLQYGTMDPAMLDRAAAIGVKWTRLSASWSSVEHERGRYDWSSTDEAFSGAIKRGITPFVTIGGSSPLYCPEYTSPDPKLAEIYGSRPAPPTRSPQAMQAWLAFVRALIERYREFIRHWEIWNEPNHFAYWGAEPNAGEYGRLVRETARVIKTVDPRAVIIAGATAGLDPEFTDGFLKGGTARLIDKVSFHNYGDIPEARVYQAAAVRRVIDRHNPAIGLWQGECGCPSASSTRDYRGIGPWGLNIQAKWLLRQAFTDVFYCRAEISTYFKLVDPGKRSDRPKRSNLSPIDSVFGFPERGGSRVKSIGVNEKCLLQNPGLEPKPAYFAYQNLCALVDNRYKPVKVNHAFAIKNAGTFYGIGPGDDAFPSVPLLVSFKTGEGHFLLAHWLPWHAQEIVKPATVDVRIDGAAFRDPVLVDLLTGRVYRFDRIKREGQSLVLTDLPLADYPLAVVERSEVSVGKKVGM